MADIEKALRIAVKLDECRDTLKRLYPDRYAAMVSQWRELIRDLAESCGISPLEALVKLLKSDMHPATRIWLCAAAVDECEVASHG